MTQRKKQDRDKKDKKAPIKNSPSQIGQAEETGEPSTSEQRVGKKKFHIVGVGASAGGLEAFEQLFSQMPSDSGMAFVLVPHLDPAHASILSGLLQKHTDMKVAQVEDGVEVLPNHVYVIPPNKDLAMLNGVLQLIDTDVGGGLRMPIDYFFRSLAQDQGE